MHCSVSAREDGTGARSSLGGGMGVTGAAIPGDALQPHVLEATRSCRIPDLTRASRVAPPGGLSRAAETEAGPHRAGVGVDLPVFLVSLLADCGTIRARRETAMLSPEIIAICAALVFTVVLSTSISWLWIGLRGRLIDTHPRCRRCGYDLTGHPCRRTRGACRPQRRSHRSLPRGLQS